MKTLTVTDEQYAFVQHLREEIAEDVVGKYGFVREQDAVQFLIDNLADDVEIEGDYDSSAADDVAASVGAAINGEPEPNHFEAVSYIESPETGTDEQAIESDETEPLDADEPDDKPDGDGPETADDAADDGADGDDPDSDANAGDSDADGDESADDGDGAADDDDMLDEMMSLLETHDDKWEESSSADYRYTVELPDGSTEDVQTKDDVRALLFKNYR